MGISKHENEKYDDYKNYVGKLQGEYKTTFEKIDIYINSVTKLTFMKKNDCFLQILDTFLSAQEEGTTVKEITGGDLSKYCDDMIYGESINIYKASKICFNFLGAFIYISFMYFSYNIFDSIYLKDRSLIFRSMNFGTGELVLLLGE